jgi:epoxyqueuosine reductase
MDSRATAELLKSWALAAGFDRAGVAALAPAESGEAYLRWLARGDQAGMGYLERRIAARLDPATVLDGARSALCVALQYWPLSKEGEPAGDLWPRVARYARGRDYHEVMGERLAALAGRVEEAFPGAATRPYVDTGPVLERALGGRAGLGAVGKNTNLLHPEAGSWFLLGELFTTLDLDPDLPLADLCGSCTRCLEACPTGALPEAYRLDANRCISYWTIEHRGAIPVERRSEMGEWVFGCDICQEVCPWNAAPAAGTGGACPELALPAARAELDLAGLLGLGREEYVERFRGSPMKRPKLAGLRRNAAVAMGNRREPRYVEALARALSSDEEETDVACHAAWALGRIGGAAAVRALETAGEQAGDPELRAEIEAALRQAAAG